MTKKFKMHNPSGRDLGTYVAFVPRNNAKNQQKTPQEGTNIIDKAMPHRWNDIESLP